MHFGFGGGPWDPFWGGLEIMQHMYIWQFLEGFSLKK